MLARGPSPGSRVAAPAALLVALAAALASCARGPEPVHVRNIRLADGGPSPALLEAGLDAETIVGAARAALEAAGFRSGDGSRPHVAVVGVSSVRILGEPAGLRGEVTFEIALAPAGPAAGQARRQQATAAIALAGAASPRDAWRGALTAAAQRAAAALAVGVRADGKSVEALLADLSANDEGVREEAVRVLGERRSKAAVPLLIERLQREEPRLAYRIVGALAQIGDERAVPALIDLSRGTDVGGTTRLVRFIGDIGGREAEAYLLTLDSGHPDARVRRAAREALDDLAARAKDAPVAARK